MKRHLQHSSLVLLIACLSTLVACEPDKGCNQNITAHMRMDMTMVTILPDGTKQASNVDSITMYALGCDSAIAKNAKNVQNLKMEMHPDSSFTTLEMLFHGQKDTLTIYHTNTIRYVDLACGCAIYHTIDSIQTTQHQIDSIQILNTNIGLVEEENLQIWLHP